MSDINIVYAYFDTYNYTGNIANTSYALPFAKFTFIPRLSGIDPIFSTKKLIWNFGDGTIVETVTATHAYAKAGTYRVTYSLFTVDGQCYLNSFYQDVNVSDFVPSTINIRVSDPNIFQVNSSQISSPIYITNSIPYQSLTGINDNKTIVAYSSGCTDNYFKLGLDKQSYGHLHPYSSFYLLETGLNQLTDYVEISAFQTITTPLFCKLSGNSIIYTDITDSDAFFCGLTGYQNIYFKSDIPKNCVNLLFGYQPGELIEFANTSTMGISANIVQNTNYSFISINSNGITSEGTTSNLFPLGTNKFGNTKIGFVAKAKDTSNYTNKLGTLVDINNITVKVLLDDNTSLTNYTTVSANFGSLSSLDSGCFFKGYLSIDLNNPSMSIGSNTYYAPYAFKSVSISISGTFNGSYITGQSNKFNLYSKDYYNIAKKGEDIDMTQQFKDIAMQPLFLDNPILFDDFMGSIVGNISSNIGDTLGKRPYEKIKNFVSNNTSFDYAGIQSLESLTKQTGNSNIQFNNSNYLYPANMGRLIDLLSINFNKLKGFADTSNEDFKTFGYQDSEVYGTNLGNEISTLNYIITAGSNIVAFEKYSGKFTVLDTYLPLVASLSAKLIDNNYKTYALSSYNSTWGWGLVIPNNTTIQHLNDYYIFYSYIPGANGTISNSIINYDDVTNTLSPNISSYIEWSQPDGIIANILTNQLYTGLNLFN